MKVIRLPKDKLCPHCELLYRQPEIKDGKPVCPHCKNEVMP